MVNVIVEGRSGLSATIRDRAELSRVVLRNAADRMNALWLRATKSELIERKKGQFKV